MSDQPNRLFMPYVVGGSERNQLAPAPTWADAADWHIQNLADTWQAMQQPKTWTDAAQQYGNALLMGTTAPGIRAFHGSPYSFERFDASKIGTGEGAQAYGHGLYFAENEGVAKSYKQSNRQTDYRLQGGDGTIPDWLGNQINQYPAGHEYYNSTIDNGIKMFNERIAEAQAEAQGSHQPWLAEGRIPGLQQVVDSLQKLRSGEATLAPRGSMYEVNIGADPQHFLDWDKPLSEQSQHVRDRLTQLGVAPERAPATEGMLKPIQDRLEAALSGTQAAPFANMIAVDATHARGRWDLGKIREMLPPEAGAKWDAAISDLGAMTSPQKPEAWAHLTGQDAHDLLVERQQPGVGEGIQFSLGKSTSRDVAAAQAMRDAGIPGIRYLDAGSRGAGQGSSNYVVFDPATIEILRKYGIAGLGLGLGAGATQGNQ